jgi:hypothetical protein
MLAAAAPITDTAGLAEVAGRIAIILVVAAGVHLAVILLRRLASHVLQARIAFSKVKTLTGFIASSLIFILYFAIAGCCCARRGWT